MTGKASMRLLSRSAEETERIGFDVASSLRCRRGGATILLYGDLGAGKTTLVRGIASALGIPARDVASASFVIVVEYDSTPPLYHVDLYRIGSPAEVDSLGLWDYIESGGITAVEWAEKLTDPPDDAVRITFSLRGPDERLIEVEGMPEKTCPESLSCGGRGR
ncbi:MAG: tRNA (adenosine(37)-N6)-threonylcarbamoyltransferase complex ATPase subunit type 1 TsaE [Chloroflexota bacterium]